MRQHQTIAEVIAHIAAHIVVIYLRQHILLNIILGIGVAALIVVAKRSGVIQRPAAAHLPDCTQTTTSTLAPIYIATVVGVVEEAIGAVVVTTNRVGELLACLVVKVELGTQTVARAVLHRSSQTLVVQGREGVYIHLSAHSVTTIERTLRASQQLHTSHIGHLKIVVVLIKVRHSINGHTDDRLVDTRTEATHIDRRGHS